jgi:thiamine biosynthesis lipoprotein
MGMPVTVEVVDASATDSLLEAVFDHFEYVDAKFSTYKDQSEISKINRNELSLDAASEDMKLIFALAEQTRLETNGYFDIRHGEQYDPSGVVKGWAIFQAAEILRQRGAANFYIDAGGDIQMAGKNGEGENWRVGIRNPFHPNEIVKALSLTDCGVATSGTYVRGQHIYNPMDASDPMSEIVSLTVIGPNVCEADRYATAAFAMGAQGIYFIEAMEGFDGYVIDRAGRATYTTDFHRYLLNDEKPR